MGEGMYHFKMPTELLKEQYETRFAEQAATIARLQRRATALEAFLPEGLEINDDGEVTAKLSD